MNLKLQQRELSPGMNYISYLNWIDEPTRITMTTSSVIDHIVTNTPEHISDPGVIHTGISDHSLIFAIRKISVLTKQEHTMEIRNMKTLMTINSVLNC